MLDECRRNPSCNPSAPGPTNAPTSESVEVDSDGDGLVDSLEVTLGTDPMKADTDGDGLNDGVEINLATDPLRDADKDNDGLTDAVEAIDIFTNPSLADTDGDGLSDGQEVIVYGTNPFRNEDKDEDGLTDAEEGTWNVVRLSQSRAPASCLRSSSHRRKRPLQSRYRWRWYPRWRGSL